MRITAFLPTHDLPAESMPWMIDVRNVFDELLIFIDERRVTPGTVKRAQQVATRVHHHKAEKWYGFDAGRIGRMCESDWIFVIERDEQLSPEWQQNQWRQILETTQHTHFWVPRRWIVPSARYIACEPWWPDLHIRLFRSNVEGSRFPTSLHDHYFIPGPGGCFQNLTIHHHALWLFSRADREERMRYYERLRPGGSLSHFYLYEDYSPPTAPLPEPVRLNIREEVGQTNAIAPEDISKISLELNGVPNRVAKSTFSWIDAKVINETEKALSALPPFPVRLAYHWIDKATREVVVFDGQRSGLFPAVPANSSRTYEMLIVAPDQPGEYILQTTMVQDGMRWLDEINPKIRQEFELAVVAE